MDEKTLKSLAELRESLTDEIAKLQEKIMELQAYVSALDIVLKKSSFKTAADLVGITASTNVSENYELTEIKSTMFGVLAKVKVYPDHIVILPENNVKLDTNLGPFTKFLVSKVLEKAKSKKNNAKSFNYTIEKDDSGNLQKLIITNYGSKDDLSKLIGALRWTFEKIKR